MSHDSRAIANIFVEKSHEEARRLSIMQLVKLVYIAHGWTLGYTSKPLIKDEVQAWRYGPVVPKVYNAFRDQGVFIYALAESAMGNIYRAVLDKGEMDIINGVYKEYASLSPFKLSAITHREGTPWSEYKGHNYQTIPNKVIEDYYKKIVSSMEQNMEQKEDGGGS